MRRSRILLSIAGILFFWNIWGYDLWAPDEPYFGEGAREMVADGRWAVPHVNGVVTTDKPPLFFWLIALFSLPLGEVTSTTARLTSGLAGLGSLILTLRLGRRMANEGVALLAGLLLTTSFLFWDKARTAQIDGLLCFLILAALSAFEAHRAGDADGRKAGLLFWLAAALAVLAKGPVGFLLPLGVALATLAFDRNLRAWKRFAPVSGPLLFLGIIAAWMVLATFGGQGEYSVWGAIREHVLDRAVHGMHHARPFWYYGTVLPADLAPWSLFLPGALWLAWRRRASATDRFLLVWALFIIVFFSISTEKRDLYVLPAFPALALLLSRMVHGLDKDSSDDPPISRRWATIPALVTPVLLIVAGIYIVVANPDRGSVPIWMGNAIAVLLIATGAGGGIAALRGGVLRWVAVVACGFSVTLIAAVTLVYPHLNSVKSSRAFSAKIRAATEDSRSAGHVVPSFWLSNLPEAFSFYTNGIYLPELEDPRQLTAHFEQAVRVYAVADREKLALLPDDVRQRLVVVESTRLSRKDVVLIHNGEPSSGG